MAEKPEITENVNAQMPFGATLGIRTFGDADEVDATLEFSPDLCTAGGALHGGVLMPTCTLIRIPSSRASAQSCFATSSLTFPG